MKTLLQPLLCLLLLITASQLCLLLLITASCNGTAETSINLTPPASLQVSAAITNRRLGTTDLVWIAPGDDGFEGFVTRYEVRRATSVITDANFDQATLIEEVSPQVAAQQEESYTVAELPWNPPMGTGSITHYVAVVGFDDLDNRTLVGDNVEVTLELAESRFSGLGAGSGIGFDFGSVGDLNNDGRDEMVVLLRGDRGGTHLIYGSDDLDAIDGEAAEPQLLTGPHDDYIGLAVGRAAALGDINGDNIDDMAISAPWRFISAPWGDTLRGTVYVYFGVDGGQISGDPDVDIDGLEGLEGSELSLTEGTFGLSVGSAGNFSDVADEGIADLIVGAPGDDGAGAAYVLLGRTSWDSNITVSADEATNEANLVVKFNSDVAGGEFGHSSAPLSDLNSDGFNEVAIAAYRGVNNQNGVVSIFTGGTLSNLGELHFGQDDQQILPPSRVAGVASADFDGDEVLDLVINAYADAISVYLFDQGVPSDASETWFTPTGVPLAQLAVGDINADGSPDIVAGGFFRCGWVDHHCQTGDNIGRLDVYINEAGTFGGNPSLRYDRANNWANDVNVGDFNGDGFEDVVAGHKEGSSFIILY